MKPIHVKGEMLIEHVLSRLRSAQDNLAQVKKAKLDADAAVAAIHASVTILYAIKELEIMIVRDEVEDLESALHFDKRTSEETI